MVSVLSISNVIRYILQIDINFILTHFESVPFSDDQVTYWDNVISRLSSVIIEFCLYVCFQQ
jgi:hypothetical protein